MIALITVALIAWAMFDRRPEPRHPWWRKLEDE